MSIENFNGSIMDRRVTKATAVYISSAGQVAELVGILLETAFFSGTTDLL